MIEFVIYDDQAEYCSMVLEAVRQATGDLFEQCIVKTYQKYDSKFESTIKDDVSSKIYIMDIEVPCSLSGIDVARKIRKKDWDSIIILVTSHVELSYEALKAQIMLLDFICKQNNCLPNLVTTLKRALYKINDRKTLNFEINSMSYRIHTDDILYIQKDPIDRRCIIKTTYNDIPVTKNLNEIKDMLDDRFYQTHRSCIVNLEKIKDVDWKDNIICFTTGDKIDYLARDKRKGLKERV